VDENGDDADKDIHQDKETEHSQELAEEIAGVGKGPGEDDLGGIRPPIPFEELRGHEDNDDSLVDIEELEAEQRDRSRKGPEVVGERKRGGCGAGRKQAQKNEAQQREDPESPGPQQKPGLIDGDLQTDHYRCHGFPPLPLSNAPDRRPEAAFCM